MSTNSPPKRGKARKPPELKLSRQRKPGSMDAEAWQRTLRRQFGREQDFGSRLLAGTAPYAEFEVSNPAAKSRYRVAIRGLDAGDNRCTCADFASNELGTCKHIEFTLHRLMSKRGAKAAFARGWVPAVSEVWLQQGGQRSIRWRAAPDAPALLQQRAQGLFSGEAQSLPLERLPELYGFIAAARRAGHALQVGDDVLDFAARLRDTQHREAVLVKLYPAGGADRGLQQHLLKTRLYPYQAEGALFAARAGRALIADEMGLGKTVQAIAAMELLARHFGVQRVLVVCPTSLKHQWQREIARFAGREAMVVGGLRTRRIREWQAEAFCKIVNYDALAGDIEAIDGWAPELLIVDEAQRVKNWNTLAARAIRRLQAPHVVVLTGTPLENRLDELVAIVQLVDQHRLGPTWRLRDRHQITDDSGRVIGYRELDQLGATLAPLMLRRRKAEVLQQLPERIDKTLFVPLAPEQRHHHDENGLMVSRIVARWRKTGFLSDLDQRRLQAALQRMRMACNSSWLLDGQTDDGLKAGELMLQLEDLFEDPSAKAVVFSQWLGTHELIIRRLAGRDWGHVHFHGSVPGEQRGALIERFLTDPACRLFPFTDAGGVGLNLQHAAAVVVNMDLPWNPAVLEQRIGRVHRMGQSRGVRVINFVAADSIEEGMIGVLRSKKALARGILDGGEAEVLMQGSRLAQFMNTVDAVTGAAMAARDADGAQDADEAADRAAAQREAEPKVEPVDGVSAAVATAVASAPAAADSEPAAPPAAGAATGAAPGEPAPAAPQPSAAGDPWVTLVDAGLALLRQLSAKAPGAGGDARAPSPFVHRDAAGRQELRLPLPEPETLQLLAEGLARWVERQGRLGSEVRAEARGDPPRS